MKKLIFTSAFVIASTLIFAQVIYFGAGYNLASGSFKELNNVINRLNDIYSPWEFDPEMEEIHSYHGMTYEISLVQPFFQGGFGLQYNRSKTQTKWIDDNGTKQQWDLWIRSLSLPLEFGIALGEDGFTAVPGLGVSFMFWRYFTRAGDADGIDDIDYYKADTDVAFQTKFYIKFILGGISNPGLGFIVEPYYNLGILRSDLMEMDNTLNDNIGFDYNDEIKEGFSHYGVRLMLILKMGG